ncbi:MAG: hypothetical protein MJZ81_07625 [Bacteroidales bacterium]|nr:hypothetical protein [Bacteroidales bacterium]
MVDVVEFSDGVTVRPATEDDFREANAFMREEDRFEVQVFGEDEERFDEWDEAVAVRIDGDLVGILGFVKIEGDSVVSRRRGMTFLTTDAVWRHRKAFVRQSRNVANWAFYNLLPAWVDTVCATTTERYSASIAWEERVLGFRRTGVVELNGVRHVCLERRKGGV